MSYLMPGRMRSAEQFRAYLQALDPEMDCVLELAGGDGPLGQALRFGERTLGNRFCIHPMEGWDGTADGLPSEHTLRRWARFGASGAKLIWGGEAFAVQADGRANAHQLFLNPAADSAGGLRRLLATLREAHAAIGEDPDSLFAGLQLTHSGRFAQPHGRPAPRIAFHHPILDRRVGAQADHALLSDEELADIGDNYVAAARLAQQVGFDFVDLKACHGYLLHETLSARSRPGRYGGSFEHRTRFFREVLHAIRAACPGLEVAVRLSAVDVFPYSRSEASGVGEPLGWQDSLPYEHGFGVDRNDPRDFDFEEPMRFLALLREEGVRLVNISVGSPYYCPHLQRPAAYPPSDGYSPPDDPLTQVIRQLRVVRTCKAAFPDLILVGSGYSYLQEYLPHVAEYEIGKGHVDFVGLGRMVLSYPDLPRDVLAGRELDRRRICRTFSDCTTGPRHGMKSGCYPLDSFYKQSDEAARIKELRPPR